MNRSLTIIQLLEEYVTTKNVYGKEVVLFKNPSSADIREIAKSGYGTDEARVIIDSKSKSVYAWNAFLANHETFYDMAGHSWWERDSDPYVISGNVPIVNNRLVTDRSSRISLTQNIHSWLYPTNKKYLDIIFKCDWSFVDKYIHGFNSLLTDLKQEYAKQLGTI